MILKSGKEIVGYYKGDEENSLKVAEKLFLGKREEVFGLGNSVGTENIFVLRSEIASMTVASY